MNNVTKIAMMALVGFAVVAQTNLSAAARPEQDWSAAQDWSPSNFFALEAEEYTAEDAAISARLNSALEAPVESFLVELEANHAEDFEGFNDGKVSVASLNAARERCSAISVASLDADLDDYALKRKNDARRQKLRAAALRVLNNLPSRQQALAAGAVAAAGLSVVPATVLGLAAALTAGATAAVLLNRLPNMPTRAEVLNRLPNMPRFGCNRRQRQAAFVAGAVAAAGLSVASTKIPGTVAVALLAASAGCIAGAIKS